MKQIDLARIFPDPLARAIADAGGDIVLVRGYVRSADKETITIAETQSTRRYQEFKRASVVAGFRDDEESTAVTLLIERGADYRVISDERAGVTCDSARCDCSEVPDVAEARPLESIHPLLAELAALAREMKAGLGSSSDLACEQARADCYREGKSEAECEKAAIVCRFLGRINQ